MGRQKNIADLEQKLIEAKGNPRQHAKPATRLAGNGRGEA